MSLRELLRNPIAFHRCFVDLTGSVASALMLSQALYWSYRTSDEDGWFYKSCKDWTLETGLGRYEQDQAREALRQAGFWFEELHGVPATTHFRIDEDEIIKLVSSLPPSLQKVSKLRSQKVAKLDCPPPANQIADGPQTFNSSEITSETTAETVAAPTQTANPEWEAFQEREKLRKDREAEKQARKGGRNRSPLQFRNPATVKGGTYGARQSSEERRIAKQQRIREACERAQEKLAAGTL